jgi:FKBP-type peptidyl-prolyl cis-trans isomerase SlyD
MRVAKDTAVTVNYTLSNELGETLETSKGKAPLTYIHGAGLIKGFERALEGRSPEETFSFTLKPEEAYGERRQELLFHVKKEQVRDIPELTKGMPLRVRTADGAMVAMVVEIEDEKVLLDANHPLAGMTLTFDVEVLDVREATQAELADARQCHEGGCAGSCGDTCGDSCGEGCSC